MRFVRPVAVIVAAIFALVAWDGILGLWALHHPGLPEDWLFVVDKVGISLVFAGAIALFGAWRAAGLAGPLAVRSWPLLWPCWVDIGASVAGGLAITAPMDLLCWLIACLGIGFSEEVVFRGIAFAVLPLRPRGMVIATSLLFGATHLVNLAVIDWRMVLAQAVTAAGLGVALGAVRVRTASLWPGVVAHAVMDYAAIIAAGGIGEALAYSPALIAYQVGMGLLAASWGFWVLTRGEASAVAAGQQVS